MPSRCPSGRRLRWGLRGQNPLSSQVSIILEPRPKAKFNRQEAQVWTQGGLRRGMCTFFLGQPCSGTAEPVWMLHGTRTWDEAAGDREKAGSGLFQLSFVSVKRGVWGREVGS